MEGTSSITFASGSSRHKHPYFCRIQFKVCFQKHTSKAPNYTRQNNSNNNKNNRQCLLDSSSIPSVRAVSELIDTYASIGRYDQAYSLALSCFGEAGELDLVESTLNKMDSLGIPLDSVTANRVFRYYSLFGTQAEMEAVYARLRTSRIVIEEDGIRAMAFGYIRSKQFYRLGEFSRDVGLHRKNVGNLLWNLLLLSYAANFKMKTLQREFLRMVEAGFCPDLTTFNIRALAFSKMSLFWDLHLTLEHMKHYNVAPDLVTYGCVVDAYVDRKLGKNLDFALSKLNFDDSPHVFTDSLVFEALGKGDFHFSSEAFMEFKEWRKWTYRKLVALYLKKRYRSHQIFWNY